MDLKKIGKNSLREGTILHEKNGEKIKDNLYQTFSVKDEREKKETLKELIINYLITTVNDRIDKLKKTGHIYIEGEFALQTHLTNKEKNALRFLEKQDITVKNILKRDYQGEKYQIVLLVIREEQYTVIHVPKKIQEMKYQDTKAKQLVQFQNEDWYPAFLTDKKLKSSLDKEWVIWQSEPNKNADGSPKVEMDVYNDGCHQEDIVRECAKKGMGMMSLTDIFILIELVNEKFGELGLSVEFCKENFKLNQTSSEKVMLDNSDEIKNNKLKKLLKKIEQEFQIKFIVNTDKYPGYLNRDYSIYRQQKPYKMTNKYSEVVDEYFAGFLRGSYNPSNPKYSIDGGVFSILLHGGLNYFFKIRGTGNVSGSRFGG